MSQEITDIIAQRELYLIENKQKKPIFIILGKPQTADSGENWRCPCQIKGLGDDSIFYAEGVDAFQALELGLQIIGSRLWYQQVKKNRHLRWLHNENHELGFPLPSSLTRI